MKTFRWAHGGTRFSTMTIGELKSLLSKYPDDIPVLAEWEGQFMPLDPDVKIVPYDPGFEADRADCLVINVDGYF